MKAVALCVAILLSASAARAAGYPAPKEGDWIVRDFTFHTGEVLPELRGHGTTGSAKWWKRDLAERLSGVD